MPATRTVSRAADLDDVIANGNKIPTALLPASGGGATTDVSELATDGDGTPGDPYTGWDAAFAALVTDGASFLFNGYFQAASNIDLSNRTSVTLFGYDGHLGQAPYNTPTIDTPTCAILFNINGPNIKAWNTAGITLRGLLIRNTQTVTFTSALVDGGSNNGTNVSMGLTIEDCVLDAAGGTGSGAPDSCLKLDNAIEGRFTGVCFYGAKYNVRGVQQYPYSTAHSFRLCRFHSATQVPILNPHMQWNFKDCVFEPAAAAENGRWVRTDSGMATASGAGIDTLTFDGCYMWDNGGGGEVLSFNHPASNVTLRGCYTNSVGGVHIAVASGVTLTGLTLIGNHFNNGSNIAGNGTLLKPSSFGTISRVSISGNIYGTGVDNLEAAVLAGQVADGFVVDSAGNQLLPSRLAVSEQRVISLVGVPFAATASKWSLSDSGTGCGSAITIFNGLGAGPADGDFIEFKLYLAAGTYTFDITARQSTDQGKIQMSLDGTNFGALTDLYVASAQFSPEIRMTGITVAASGVHRVRLTVTGKNASSTNYYVRLGTTWVLTRTA